MRVTKTGTQNRPYPAGILHVRASFFDKCADKSPSSIMDFNWNKRADVQAFAAFSDKIVRAGGRTVLEGVSACAAETINCIACDGTGQDPDVDDDGKPYNRQCGRCRGAGSIDHITVEGEPVAIVARFAYPAPASSTLSRDAKDIMCAGLELLVREGGHNYNDIRSALAELERLP